MKIKRILTIRRDVRHALWNTFWLIVGFYVSVLFVMEIGRQLQR